MRDQFIMALLILPALGVANAVYFGNELKRFTQEVAVIASTSDLERFKQVVARQMYAALAQIAILVLPILIFFTGVVRGILLSRDILFIILPSAVILVVAQFYKQIEATARNLPVTDEQLREQRDAVVGTWLKRPFPDWE